MYNFLFICRKTQVMATVLILEDKPWTILTFSGLVLKYFDSALIIALLDLPLIGNSFIVMLISPLLSSTWIYSIELNLTLTKKI